MKKSLFVLIFCCSFFHRLLADDIHMSSVYAVSANDTIKVYNTFMYSSLHTERLENMKSMPMRNEDIMTLNEMLDRYLE